MTDLPKRLRDKSWPTRWRSTSVTVQWWRFWNQLGNRCLLHLPRGSQDSGLTVRQTRQLHKRLGEALAAYDGKG